MPILVALPDSSGAVARYRLKGEPVQPSAPVRGYDRIVYAAAHVVADPIAPSNPSGSPHLDWDATLAFRRHLWGLGFRVAEAMDTAQRGGGLDWPTARELILRSLSEARTIAGADVASGAGTDQLSPADIRSIADVIAAYEEQFEIIEGAGGRAIMMASRALARIARGAEDYGRVYDTILRQARKPVILHWLGEMFDPQLAGYWGSDDFETQAETVLAVIEAHSSKIDGIKISLLSCEKEIALRRRLPDGVRTYTGDDFNYPTLIEGDGQDHSDVLLGIFDPIATVAAHALAALADKRNDAFHAVLDPTVPLSRKMFEAPTRHYKAGIVFLAWLNGFQNHFTMVGGMQSSRGIVHYAEVFRLADAAGILRDPEQAARRMALLAQMHGIDQ